MIRRFRHVGPSTSETRDEGAGRRGGARAATDRFSRPQTEGPVGGQRQRVAIGRAIVRNPEVFLFDESLSNLDAGLRAKMRPGLSHLHVRVKATMVYVTYDQVEAMTMADKTVILNKGRIEQVGTPMDLYNHPATPFVAGFIGSPQTNIFEGTPALGMSGGLYGIRPEHINISRTDGEWSGVVRHIERFGADATLFLDIADLRVVTISMDGNVDTSVGDRLFASPQTANEHRFASQT